ncbi:MAG: AsmA family protein, partial [Paramuribaculum sp.]|nr:AsmA family protein [Paramuribaculum sp.]
MDTKDENKNISGKRKKSGLRRVLKWIFVPLAIVLLLIAAAISIGVWLLSPDELTPMMSEYSSKYLDANVTAGKVELSFWSTFPKVSLKVDKLTVVSKSLKDVPDSVRRRLPADADTLLTLEQFDGGVNIWALMGGTVMLYDVTFRKPDINIVQVNDSTANYLIVPPTEVDSTETDMPYIVINRFAIEGGAPVRIFSLADSVDMSVKIADAAISGTDAPVYTLDIEGSGGGEVMPGLRLADMKFGVDGRVGWNQRNPHHIELQNFSVSANNIGVKINTKVNFEKSPVIETLQISGKDISLADLIAMVPEQYAGSLKKIDTDVAVNFTGELLKPYAIESKALPAMKASLLISDGHLNYDRMALKSLKADIEAVLPEGNAELAHITLNELTVNGRSLSFSLDGTLSNLSSEAAVDGNFRGQLNTSMLPR